MAKIVHLIECLWLGGAVRAAIAAAKYSARTAGHEHFLLPLFPTGQDEMTKHLANENGVGVIEGKDRNDIVQFLSWADIVQLNWWNTPAMDAFLRGDLPPMRIAGWFHVGGHRAPQIITPALIDFCDMAIACSPYTYECPAIQSLPPHERSEKTGMAYGPADFARLGSIRRKPHDTFNVGYVGTVDFIKMHREYIALNAAVKTPNTHFVVCGDGPASPTLVEEAAARGMAERFHVLGYVPDISPVLEILDVYGYPLCEDTYAASECNLQEVMYCGIPPVVFPYGGVKRLVIHETTGLIVNSAAEYAEAIEHLYYNPQERERLGSNAREYAAAHFGAENAARVLNRYYEALLAKPKRNRTWNPENSTDSQPIAPGNLLVDDAVTTGARRFTENLHDQGTCFFTSLYGRNEALVLSAEAAIAASSDLMYNGGILVYLRQYPEDPFLLLWAALGASSRGQCEQTVNYLASAVEAGFGHWRAFWYIAKAAKTAGLGEIELKALQQVVKAAPDFQDAKEALNGHKGNFAGI